MLLGQASASPRTTKSDFRKPNLHKSAPPRVHVSTGLRTHGPMGPELHGSMAPWAGLSSVGEVWLIPRSTAPRVHGPTGPPLVEPISRQVARSRDSFRNVLHIRNSGFAGVRWTTPTASRPSPKKPAVLMQSLAEPALEVPPYLNVWLREPLENPPHKLKKAADPCVELITGGACSGELPKFHFSGFADPLGDHPPHKLKKKRPPASISSPGKPVLESFPNFDF